MTSLQWETVNIWYSIHTNRWSVNSPHKGQLTRKMFPFGDVIMVAPEAAIKGRTSNYIPQILWDVISCLCPWYLLLTQRSWNDNAQQLIQICLIYTEDKRLVYKLNPSGGDWTLELPAMAFGMDPNMARFNLDHIILWYCIMLSDMFAYELVVAQWSVHAS